MSHIAAARPRAEAQLGSTCKITRAGEGAATLDPETLVPTLPEPDVIYEGPCSVGNDTDTTDDERGGRQLEGARVPVRVPVEATVDVKRGDRLTILTVDNDGDPALIGVPLTVDEVARRSRMVLRRLRCVDTRGTNGRLP